MLASFSTGCFRVVAQLADGLHLIDFEQLKIENLTLNEKIEERTEELLKLKKKTTQTVQVLTHVKEKLQFVQAEAEVWGAAFVNQAAGFWCPARLFPAAASNWTRTALVKLAAGL